MPAPTRGSAPDTTAHEAMHTNYPMPRARAGPRPKVNQFRKDGKKQKSDDPGGQGVEIVCEVKAC